MKPTRVNQLLFGQRLSNDIERKGFPGDKATRVRNSQHDLLGPLHAPHRYAHANPYGPPLAWRCIRTTHERIKRIWIETRRGTQNVFVKVRTGKFTRSQPPFAYGNAVLKRRLHLYLETF